MKADSKLLLLLVDGLPYRKVSSDLMPFLASVPVRSPLEPGLGFSINIYPELFAAKRPDDLGYFNKWQLKEPEEYSIPQWPTRFATRIADLSRVSLLASRAVHKLYERLSGSERLANVPFRLLHYYTKNPSNEIFETSDYRTVFNMWQMKHLFVYDFPGKWGEGEKDRRTIDAALGMVESNESLFLLLGETDATAHICGLGERFDAHLRRLDGWMERLVDAFTRQHGNNAHVVVVSDHGMARTNRDGAVPLALEREFGPIRYDRYVPFVESLMLRVWARDLGLLREMLCYLGELDCGHVLDDKERQYFGVVDPKFGDIIFLLDEGYAFYPSFFGYRFPKALHGYHPGLDSQQAYFGYLGPAGFRLPTQSLEVFSVFQALVHTA